VRGVKRVAGALAVVALALVGRELRLASFARHRAAQRYEDIYYLPSAQWLPVLSLGYRQALADIIWCKSLVYFGEELGQRGRVKYVFAYTDAILALDPSFRAVYRWVATAALYRPTEVSMADGLHAASYLERAIERWPGDGELHWDYGSLLRFELAPLESDRKRKVALWERAAPHLETAARLGAGPPWLAINNADLLGKLGRSEQAIKQLESMYAIVQSDEVREEIEVRLKQLRTSNYLEAFRATEENFEQERKRSYPYLSPSLFLLVGPKPAPDAYHRFVSELLPDAADEERGDTPNP
jgi:hypothetical protein